MRWGGGWAEYFSHSYTHIKSQPCQHNNMGDARAASSTVVVAIVVVVDTSESIGKQSMVQQWSAHVLADEALSRKNRTTHPPPTPLPFPSPKRQRHCGPLWWWWSRRFTLNKAMIQCDEGRGHVWELAAAVGRGAGGEVPPPHPLRACKTMTVVLVARAHDDSKRCSGCLPVHSRPITHA
jgi:hypothetical protein